MPMRNLLEYSDSSVASGSLWNSYRDAVNDNVNENNNDSYRVNNKKQQQVNLLSVRPKQ